MKYNCLNKGGVFKNIENDQPLKHNEGNSVSYFLRLKTKVVYSACHGNSPLKYVSFFLRYTLGKANQSASQSTGNCRIPSHLTSKFEFLFVAPIHFLQNYWGEVDKISSKFILCDQVCNSHDHSVLQSIDVTRRNLMLEKLPCFADVI